MTTLTVHPLTSDQETAICIFLDALHVDYKINEDADETAYLLASAANAAHLRTSIEQGGNQEITKIHLDDIWKP